MSTASRLVTGQFSDWPLTAPYLPARSGNGTDSTNHGWSCLCLGLSTKYLFIFLLNKYPTNRRVRALAYPFAAQMQPAEEISGRYTSWVVFSSSDHKRVERLHF